MRRATARRAPVAPGAVLYGKVLVVQSILYWLIYAIIWGPTVGFTRSLGHIASWDVVLLTAIYSLYWIVARGRPRSAPVLLAMDVGGSLAIGIDNVFLMLGDLGTISGVFENLIGFICILFFRSLIVPSTVKRTLLCGVLMCGPTILGVAFGPHRFDDQALSWITMVGFSINWSFIALIFSGVASAVLYGLRREVRDHTEDWMVLCFSNRLGSADAPSATVAAGHWSGLRSLQGGRDARAPRQ